MYELCCFHSAAELRVAQWDAGEKTEEVFKLTIQIFLTDGQHGDRLGEKGLWMWDTSLSRVDGLLKAANMTNQFR